MPSKTKNNQGNKTIKTIIINQFISVMLHTNKTITSPI